MSRPRVEIPPDDPRLLLFAEMLAAWDSVDLEGWKDAYRKLCRLGWTCCYIESLATSSSHLPFDRPDPGIQSRSRRR